MALVFSTVKLLSEWHLQQTEVHLNKLAFLQQFQCESTVFLYPSRWTDKLIGTDGVFYSYFKLKEQEVS